MRVIENNWSTVSSTGSDGRIVFYYAPSGPDVGWAFGSKTGITPGSAVQRPYEGARFAFLQGQTGLLTQSFSLDSAGEVTLNFALALRSGYRPGQVVQVYIDSDPIGLFAADSYIWKIVEVDLGRLDAGMHTLSFAGMSSYAQYGDTTAFIDAIQLSTLLSNTVAEPAGIMLLLSAFGILAGGRRNSPLRGQQNVLFGVYSK